MTQDCVWKPKQWHWSKPQSWLFNLFNTVFEYLGCSRVKESTASLFVELFQVPVTAMNRKLNVIKLINLKWKQWSWWLVEAMRAAAGAEQMLTFCVHNKLSLSSSSSRSSSGSIYWQVTRVLLRPSCSLPHPSPTTTTTIHLESDHPLEHNWKKN